MTSQPRAWRKSSYSGNPNNECVEVNLDEVVRVRDTKNRSDGHLNVPAVAWRAFLDEVATTR